MRTRGKFQGLGKVAMEGQRNKEIGGKSHCKTMGIGENQRISERERGK
jgi:hypothetical protein